MQALGRRESCQKNFMRGFLPSPKALGSSGGFSSEYEGVAGTL